MSPRAAALILVISTSAAAQTFDLRGFAIARGMDVSGPPSWTDRDFGRFDKNNGGEAELQISADWHPLSHFLVHAHGIARSRDSGLATAYAEISGERGRSEFDIRAGQFFLGTSRENTGDLWTSPYTINFSAINTWIAQEVRPIGVDAEWRVLTSSALITAGATAFGGNDTMGALLAWRGWTIGNRLMTFNEVAPLPPLESFEKTFVKQRKDGTVPFERDLDGRAGYSARIRYSIPERFNVQLTHIDNRGDRQLHRNEYAWNTRFNVAGAQFHHGQATIAAEWMGGKTGMGPRPGGVDADFYAVYLLASLKHRRSRFTARVDQFNTRDRRLFIAREPYDEDGRAATVSWLFDLSSRLRAGLEATRVTGKHVQAEEAHLDERFNGNSVVVEIRYSVKQ